MYIYVKRTLRIKHNKKRLGKSFILQFANYRKGSRGHDAMIKTVLTTFESRRDIILGF